ncbi:hypothetical protein C481_08441 [Natrialba asiatica DSM 12278]|uniref:Uncharacterized protein n=1 Tax=Natrialba asiatica (strain ATCC 700177 / DSM 12278 / JCM 9576 / FERM P-10747 / NBRC 102637 / 172P1) TaxID=29540 RepID=M0AWH7_NATA1|nr:hypothetical protein C481_08441 [Natrialba asiatica DSM 12278]
MGCVTVASQTPVDHSTCDHRGAHVTDRFRRVFGDEQDRSHRCSECGSYAWLPDGTNTKRLYEWDIVGRGRGESKSSFNISPRFPNMRHWETGDPVNSSREN